MGRKKVVKAVVRRGGRAAGPLPDSHRDDQYPTDLVTFAEAAALRGKQTAGAIEYMVQQGYVTLYVRYGRRLVSRGEVLAWKPAQPWELKAKAEGQHARRAA